jgi:hypothetical protein
MAGRDDLGDLGREIIADPRQSSELLRIARDLGDAPGQVLDRAGGAAIGADPKRIGALDLEKLGHPVEASRDLGVMDGLWSRSRSASLFCQPQPRAACLDEDQRGLRGT